MKLKWKLFFHSFIVNIFLISVHSLSDSSFTIEDLVSDKYKILPFSAKWISDTEIEYQHTKNSDVFVVNVATKEKKLVLNDFVLEKYNAVDYSFSPDRKYVLLEYDVQPVFKYSKLSKYVVYSTHERKYFKIPGILQHAEWGTNEHTLLFIQKLDIHILKNFTEELKPTRLTVTKYPFDSINGLGDWIYEEEILKKNKAFWFSPQGDILVWVKFLDKNVKTTRIYYYGKPGELPNVRNVEFPYPKVNTKLPDYEIWRSPIDDPLESRRIAKIDNENEIFHDLTWIGKWQVAYVVSNRVQNTSRTYEGDLRFPYERKIIFENSNAKGWANTFLPLFSTSNDRALRIEGRPTKNLGNFKHIVIYSKKEGYSLTEGEFEVLDIVHWDQIQKIVYYIATEQNNATSTQLYSVSEIKGSKPVCLSCKIKTSEGRLCKDVTASFNRNSTYFIVTCNGPDPPTVFVYKNEQPYEKPVITLDDNAEVRDNLKKKLRPEIMNLTIPISKSFNFDVRLMLPPKMDKSGATKYPIINYVYAAPGSKSITDVFKVDFGHYITTHSNVIYVLIDGRNTARKGENMLFAGYKALGSFEMEDQINVIKALKKMFKFIDPKRVGVWGMGYGGYATTKVLEMDKENVFKCGVAVSPIADWLYYNSFYTEKYMGNYTENYKAYKNASVLNDDIKNLRNKQFLLMHGNFDDRVLYQNTMFIAKLLQQNNMRFTFMTYPDEKHEIKDKKFHYYYEMDRFWRKCLKLSS